MEKKTGNELVKFCEEHVGTPYVYGMKGKTLTQDQLTVLSREYPKIFTEEYIRKARKYIGKNCTDCSGLISWFTGVPRGSEEYLDTAETVMDIKKLNETMKGWALWKKGHIGIYIGNGRCVEAKGINFGTIRSDVRSSSWEKVLKLHDIRYAEMDHPVAEAPEFGWWQKDNHWYFYKDKNQMIKNDWMEDKGRWYRFDEEGHALSRQWYLDKRGKWYYLGPDCAMVTGLQFIDGHCYYFNESGVMLAGKRKITLEPDQNGALQIMKSPESKLNSILKFLGL